MSSLKQLYLARGRIAAVNASPLPTRVSRTAKAWRTARNRATSQLSQRGIVRMHQANGRLTGRLSYLLAIAVTLLIAGCGGGGGSSPAPTLTNSPPTANAGPDQSAVERDVLQLAGSGSDSDGGTLEYAWSQVSGPVGTFSSLTDPIATFAVPLIPVGAEEAIVLRLTVRDGQGGSTSDEVTINAASNDYVVYTTQRDVPTRELYAYYTQTGTEAKLNGTLPVGGNVISFKISPDGKRIAYTASAERATKFDLYVVNADGSGNTRVSADMANVDGDVFEFEWSPDSSQLVYSADADLDNINEIFLVGRDGANPTKINGSVGSGVVRLGSPTWSPDGRYILQSVFDTGTARLLGLNTHDTTAGGFSSVRITSVPSTGRIKEISWTADSSGVVFRADADTPGVDELYLAFPDGSESIKLNDPVDADQDVRSFRLAPDASRVAYVVGDGLALNERIYTCLLNGSANVELSPTPPLADSIIFYSWSPDATRIAYTLRQDDATKTELYASDPDGANNTKLNGALMGNTAREIEWAPDSSRVAYFALQDSATTFEIYSSNADGTGNIKLSGPLAPGGGNAFLGPGLSSWSPDSQRYLYASTPLDRSVFELTVSEIGSTQAQVTRTPAGRFRFFGKWSADSSSVIYVSEQDTADIEELYLASADGLTNIKISGNTSLFSNSFGMFEWSP